MTIVEVKDDTRWIPPFVLNCSKEEEEFIVKYWHKSGYLYIVDSLGYDQCTAIEYSQMRFVYRFMFWRKFGPVHRVSVSYDEYAFGCWKRLIK